MDQYKITGMSCAACAARIEKAVSKVPGVTSCPVNLLTNSMGVEGTASPDDVIRAVADAGYGASLKSGSNKNAGFSGKTEGRAGNPSLTFENELSDVETPKLIKRLVASVILLIPLMYVSMGHMMWGWQVPGFLDNCLAAGIYEMLFAGIIMVINQKFFISGFKGILHGAPNMDTLVAMGSAASFCYSVWALFAMAGHFVAGDAAGAMSYMHELYFESAAMILALITVGKTLEAKSKGRTTDAIRALMELAPKRAVVIRDGQEISVPIEEIVVGDEFLLRAGENVPVDGIVVSGSGLVNESALTGESVPVKKEADDKVSAATTSMSGRMICRATRVGQDTTLSQIIRLVSDAAATKAPIARIADKVSGVFVPAVLGIAAVTFIVWMTVGHENVGFALARAISVLVVSCPCALGLATPVAIMVGNGVGAKHGILFKTAEALEMTGRADIIALDKTGTITKGLGAVTTIDPNEKIDTSGDEIRSDSPAAVKALKALGLYTVMVSGDDESRARMIGNEAGVDEVIAGVLPDGKDAVIKDLKARGGKVIMVGDGINDGPALTVADVGMAIGAGTDVAIDAADIVLERSTISDVVVAICLSRATLRNIRQNLFWAFFYNILLIPLAAGVYTWLLGWTMSPMLGAAAMSLSSFCVVMNALRLNFFKADKKVGSAGDVEISECEEKVKSKINETTTMDVLQETDGSDKIKSKLNKSDAADDVCKANDSQEIKSKLNKKEDIKTMEITVKGMMCQNCERHVREAIEKIDGVTAVTADHENNLVTIETSKDVPEDIIKAAIEGEGYEYCGMK